MRFISLSLIVTILLVGCSASKKVELTKIEGVTADDTLVSINTTKGEIIVKLYNDTPLHKANFIKIVNQGALTNTIFHRVIRGFMIQGGDIESKNAVAGANYGSGSLPYTVPAEFNPKYIHKKGALSAARTPDNANPKKNSSSTQFFLVQGKPQTDIDLNSTENNNQKRYTQQQREVYKAIGGSPFLDQNYTCFGEVVKGLEIVDIICAVQTDAGNRPFEDVKMLEVKILQ